MCLQNIKRRHHATHFIYIDDKYFIALRGIWEILNYVDILLQNNIFSPQILSYACISSDNPVRDMILK